MMKPSTFAAVLVALVVLVSGASAIVHSRVANHIEQLGEQRFSFCLHSAAVPAGPHFTAVLYFSFVDADGNLVDHEPTFVLGFPNAEFQLIRNVVSGSAVTVHQATSSFFNWDAEAYLNTAFSTGVVISSYRLVSVTLVVEAPEIASIPDSGLVTCDAPIFFVDEEPMADADVILQLPNEVNAAGENGDLVEEPQPPVEVVFEFSNEVANETAPTVLSWLYLGSTALVAFLSLSCMLRVCCARRQQYTTEADEEMMMVPIEESEKAASSPAVLEPLVPAPVAVMPEQLAMQPQPVMTASGVQYIMVPQEFLLAAMQQQQQQQLAALQAAGVSLYPGHFVAAPQQ